MKMQGEAGLPFRNPSEGRGVWVATMQGEAGLPFRNPSEGRGVWVAKKTTHSARGIRAYARLLGSPQHLVVQPGSGALI